MRMTTNEPHNERICIRSKHGHGKDGQENSQANEESSSKEGCPKEDGQEKVMCIECGCYSTKTPYGVGGSAVNSPASANPNKYNSIAAKPAKEMEADED